MHYVFHSMGIPVHITAIDSDEEKILKSTKSAENIFREWDKKFSRFLKDSELNRINSGAGEWQNISPLMFTVISKCVELAEIANGVFDPSVGGYLAQYGYGLPKKYELPPIPPTYRDIELDSERSRILCARGQILEPAAIVKGMAIDAAGKELSLLTGWMINAGGDILTKGDFTEQKYWNVAIQHPRVKQAIITKVKIHNEAIATSGSYAVSGTTRKGENWHHQINMRAGNPTSGLLSLSVIAQTAEKADTLASLAFLYGLQKGIDFLEKEGTPYLFIDDREIIHKNKLFAMREIMTGALS